MTEKMFKDKTAMHLSDLHIGRLGRREKKILEIIKDINPDFIFLTGDYVKWNGDYNPALAFLSGLNACIKTWSVMGDYDYSNSRKSCLLCHDKGTGQPTKKHRIRFLRNSIELIGNDKESIQIIGIDPGKDEAPIHIDGPAIILSHDPRVFETIDDRQNVLMLAGDTHGGQIPLPSFIWQWLGYEKNAKYSHGFFRKGNKQMIVSRGIGTSHLPFRLFRRPEIVVLHF